MDVQCFDKCLYNPSICTVTLWHRVGSMLTMLYIFLWAALQAHCCLRDRMKIEDAGDGTRIFYFCHVLCKTFMGSLVLVIELIIIFSTS